MRGNEFIRSILDFANTATSDANSTNYALGELIGSGFQPMQDVSPRQQRSRQVNGIDMPMVERRPGDPLPNREATLRAPDPSQTQQTPERQPALEHPANVRLINSGATRNLPINTGLSNNIGSAIESVYGPGYEARVYSGGQGGRGTGAPRVGSVRHDGGRAADLYIYDPEGNRLTGDALAPIAQFWKANNLGGVGLEMQGGGVHLDDWVEPPPGGGMSWSYGNLTAAQRAALEAGARGDMPQLAQAWAGAVVGEGNDVTAGNIYNALSDALVPSGVSSSGDMSQGGGQQVEDLIGSIIRDTFGPTTGDEDRARAHKASIFENLSVSLGQMASGQPVNVSGVLRAQEESQRHIVENRMAQHRMRAGAAAVLEGGGSPAMAQAVATGALSYRDMLSERQIANAETQLARENAQDDTRRGAMQSALRELGYTDEMIQIGAADPTSFFKLDDIMTANDAAELAAERAAIRAEGRRAVMNDLSASDDPIERRAATFLMGNPDLSVEDSFKASQEYFRQRDAMAQNARTEETARLQEQQTQAQRLQTERWANETRTRLQQAGEVDPITRDALRRYEMSGESLSAQEALDQAQEATRRDAVVVGNNLIDRQSGEPIYEGEQAATPDERNYNAGRQAAEARGEDALAEFDAQYPNGVSDFVLARAGRLGGLKDDNRPVQSFLASGNVPEQGTVVPGSLLDVAGELGGVQGAARKLSRSTAGQLFSGAQDPVFTAVETAYSSWRNDAIQSLRAGGRMLAQELALIMSDVAPNPDVMTPPGVFVEKLEVIDGELRRKMIALEAQGQALIDEGFRDSADYRDNVVARSQLSSVLQGLHTPSQAIQDVMGEDTSPMSFDTADDAAAAIRAGQVRAGDTVTVNGRTFRIEVRE